jgi:hypothetical protein
VDNSVAAVMHKRASSRALVVASRVPDVFRYSDIDLGPDDVVLGFQDKGRRGPGVVNAEVCVAIRETFEGLCPDRECFSTERDIFPPPARHGLCPSVTSGALIDIGVPDGYRRPQTLLLGSTSPCR